MSAFRGAVADLIITAVATRGDLEEVYECAQAVLAELPEAGRDDLLPALEHLADGLLAAPLGGAGVIALTAAAIVESGGPPGAALGALLDRLEEALAPAAAFAAACQAALRRPGNVRDAIARVGEQVARTHAAEAHAWNAVEPLALAALSLLAREAVGRQRARDRSDLLAGLRGLAPAHERAEQLLDLLAILDGEQIVVLYPSLGKGYLVEVEGVADVAQLHVLLAAELAGNAEAGWLPVARPDPRLAAAARNQPPAPEAGLFAAVFELWTARALRADGTLPDDAESPHRLRPNDPLTGIEPVGGTRVLLLGPPLQPAEWAPTRRFEALPGDLRVVATLTPEAVQTWLARCG